MDFCWEGLCFGLSSVGCLLWTWVQRPDQFRIAAANLHALIGMNIGAAGGWAIYFVAVQRIEPAIAFALFSGVIPLSTIAAARLGFAEAQLSRNRLESLGYLIIIAGLVALVLVTLTGNSGFVRGDGFAGLTGVGAALIAGVFICFMLLYSQRLDVCGLLPSAQFGLRFPLYLVLTFTASLMGFDQKSPVDFMDWLWAIAVAMVVLAFPIYAVQRAVSLTSALTIATIAATAPLIVFLMQIAEGRVSYSNPTSLGLIIYFAGAVIAASGTARAHRSSIADK